MEAWPELTNHIAVADEDPPTEELVVRIQEAMWRFCHPYNINNSQVPVWYIMDEFGSRIPHSDVPSIAMTSFFYVPRQLAYCLLWPLRNLNFGDAVSRDYLCDIGPNIMASPLQRACHLIPWSRDDHMMLDDPRWRGLPQCTVPPFKERCDETLPDSSLPPSHCTSPFTVYTDIELVRRFLTHSSFKLTNERETADILWSYEHFKDFGSLRPGRFVNQFGCENVLTCKDLLVDTAKRVRHSGASPQDPSQKVGVVEWTGPNWLPETYNLLYELPHLVLHYRLMEKSGGPNVWIVKPWNLGRGMDIHITSSLHHIIRLAQAGPKIASRYITDPVLFQRPAVGLVKFDIRYMILLKSVDPVEAYVYTVFWLRPFSLDNFYDYEKHFTVMNYQEGVELKQIHYNEFIPLFEEQYPDHPWADIQESIFLVLSELVRAACSSPPPAGLAPSSQCRAIYAADLMLKWNRDTSPHPGMEPQLLEVNFSPDCIRACRYHPSFFNHVFKVLFLDRSQWSPDIPVTRLV